MVRAIIGIDKMFTLEYSDFTDSPITTFLWEEVLLLEENDMLLSNYSSKLLSKSPLACFS